MAVKESIKNLLESLENEGIDRIKVGEQLGYSEKSIAPLLSRGGNERFEKILTILLQKAMLEKRIKTLEANNPAKEVALEMKKHLDSLIEQAGALKEIVDRNANSDDPKITGPRSLRNPGVNRPDEIPTFGGKLGAQDHPGEQGKSHVKDKLNKGKAPKN